MVFENLTLFEIQFEDAQFGPRSLSRSRDDPVETVAESASAGGGGRGRLAPLVLLTVLALGAAMVWRRSRGGADISPDAGAAEADLATAQ